MILSSIQIENVLGVADAKIHAHRPVVLVCGPNGAGKSSIAEAVRFALLGETPRGTGLKKDYPALLHTGAKAGGVTVTFDSGHASVVLPSGTRAVEGLPTVKGLEFCLSPERFVALDAKERRAALFDLMGVKTSPAVVKERLTARGVDEARAAQVLPLLAAGFDAACKEAQAKARDAKAAWRAITSETYGSQKAEAWSAQAPAIAQPDEAAVIEGELAALDQQINERIANVGGMQARAADAQKHDVTIKHLRSVVERKDRILAKLDHDQAEFAAWQVMVAKTEASASGKQSGAECQCPDCGASLVFDGGKLEAWKQPDEGSAEAAAKLVEYRESLRLLDNAVRNGQRDLAEAEKAEAQLETLTAAKHEAPDAAEVDAAKTELDVLREKRRRCASELEGVKAAIRAHEQAATTTAKASAEHQNVQAWDEIAKALSPDGIPAELLASALHPFNDELHKLAELAGWMPVFITNEMAVSVGGMPYEYRSESEKWRADTLIAAAIARIGGSGFVMLDRFDVLDANGRADALYLFADWGLSALVLGTLKSMPNVGDLGIQAEWIQDGTVGAVKEAA